MNALARGAWGLGLAACLALGLAAAEAEKPAAEKPAKEKPVTFGPPAGARWEVLPDFTDEFEGKALDRKKWHPTNPKWQGRQPGWFAPENVTVADGNLVLAMKREDRPNLPEGYHTYTSAAVKSTRTVMYGYFEVRAKPMKSRGSSAFWFYDNAPDRWTEIDVFEIGGGSPGHERKYYMNVHVFRTPEEPNRHWDKPVVWEAPWNLADDYHVYALEWDKDRLRWYVDGVVRRTQENTHWHQPLYLNFDSETMSEWFGLPEAGTLPSTFRIDYVRAWKRADGQAPAGKGDAARGG